jgi:lysozyme family protein
MSAFAKAFEAVIGLEGGHVNNPNDAGGETKYGITARVARAHGWTKPMVDLPLEVAKEIAKEQYWDVLQGDQIALLSERVMSELFDTGYNCGVSMAGQFLQHALNALNRQAKDYDDLRVDGLIGPMTIYALGRFMRKRGQDGELVLLKALNCLQGNYYMMLGEHNEDFVYGWLRNRVAL